MTSPSDRLTGFDRELLSAIQQSQGIDGLARSLFDIAVRRSGFHYGYSHDRLAVLEMLGYVQVERPRGLPMVIRLKTATHDTGTLHNDRRRVF